MRTKASLALDKKDSSQRFTVVLKEYRAGLYTVLFLLSMSNVSNSRRKFVHEDLLGVRERGGGGGGISDIRQIRITL